MRAEERRERTEPRSCSRTAPQHRPRRVQPPPDARLLSNQSSASGGAANRHPARCDDARRGDRPRAAVLRLAEERAAEPGLSELLRRGPRCPSLADALEGLRDAEPYYRHLHRPVAGRGGAGRGSPARAAAAAAAACKEEFWEATQRCQIGDSKHCALCF